MQLCQTTQGLAACLSRMAYGVNQSLTQSSLKFYLRGSLVEYLTQAKARSHPYTLESHIAHTVNDIVKSDDDLTSLLTEVQIERDHDAAGRRKQGVRKRWMLCRAGGSSLMSPSRPHVAVGRSRVAPMDCIQAGAFWGPCCMRGTPSRGIEARGGECNARGHTCSPAKALWLAASVVALVVSLLPQWQVVSDSRLF